MAARIGLSTASVYPLSAAAGFELAGELGYDGVEVMVTTESLTQQADQVQRLASRHGVPVLSVHTPCLLLTQRVWGTEPWVKVDRSLALARELGAQTVVVHPPFRWQRQYAEQFADGVAAREADSGVAIAVENMFPWRAARRTMAAYLPDWDPTSGPYDHVTLDLSHCATAGSDALAMAATLGGRLRHVHLADGSGSNRDEHLVPGRGGQPCAQLLQDLGASGYDGDVIVEISTRRSDAPGRIADLAESLAFARRHLEGCT